MSSFPSQQLDSAESYCDGYFVALAEAAKTIDRGAVARAAEVLTEAILAGRTIYSCGNGGSAAIADHLTCDFLKGIRTDTDVRPRVVSLVSTVSLVTAIANDIGYDQAFSFQLETMGQPGDVLVAVSSSGGSPNIVRAVELAKARGMTSIVMTGFSGGASRVAADVSIHVQADNYGVIEDLHQSVMHLLAQYIRQSRVDPERFASVKF